MMACSCSLIPSKQQVEVISKPIEKTIVQPIMPREIDLKEDFQGRYISEYEVQYKKNNDSHFSDAVEMREFFEDGVAILEWFKKKCIMN